MKTYTGTFLKKNGDLRTMNFIRLPDLPTEFVTTKIKGNRKPNKLTEGLELVWDIDASEFRIFNWKTIQGDINEREAENLLEESA